MKRRDRRRETQDGRRRGWSLIEMLVVMVIMTVLVGLSANVFKAPVSSHAVKDGLGTICGIFREASMTARAQNRPVRIILNSDSSDSRRYLRVLGIEMVEPDADGNLHWVPVGRGAVLPERVRVFREHLEPGGGATQPVVSVKSAFPRRGGPEEDWLAFEVDSRGRFAQAGATLVVGPAAGTEPNLRRGLLILRVGVPMALDTLPSL